MIVKRKDVVFCARSFDDLRAFPSSVQLRLGYQIGRLQEGFEPSDWKPMQGNGKGVREIRVATEDGAFRSVYVAHFSEAIYILHCFQKKTQKT